jgi:hypothetical protein
MASRTYSEGFRYWRDAAALIRSFAPLGSIAVKRSPYSVVSFMFCSLVKVAPKGVHDEKEPVDSIPRIGVFSFPIPQIIVTRLARKINPYPQKYTTALVISDHPRP